MIYYKSFTYLIKNAVLQNMPPHPVLHD